MQFIKRMESEVGRQSQGREPDRAPCPPRGGLVAPGTGSRKAMWGRTSGQSRLGRVGGWAHTGRGAWRTRRQASDGSRIAQRRSSPRGHVEMRGTLGQLPLDRGLQTEILMWTRNHSFIVTKRNTPCVWLKTGRWVGVGVRGWRVHRGSVVGRDAQGRPRGRGRGPLEVGLGAQPHGRRASQTHTRSSCSRGHKRKLEVEGLIRRTRE